MSNNLRYAEQASRSISHTHTGHVRGQNQDAVFQDDVLGLWLVADGMGGHAGGETASRLARTAVVEAVSRGAAVHDAVQEAHRRILQAQNQNPDLVEMGTTVVGVHEDDGTYTVFWVGDSRAYRFSQAGELEMLTRDHNLAGMLVESGALDANDARRHPQRHVLTECLGFVGHETIRCDLLQRKWAPGEVLLLCSDGLTNELETGRIAAILRDADSLQAAADRMLEEALAAGGRDNVSLVLVTAPATPIRPVTRSWLRPWS